MVSLKGLCAALLTWATLANAFCIQGVNICTEVVVPKSSSQDLYIQIKAPDTSGWAGVGIGNGMTGSLIFVVYPNAGKTNLTLSPRLGVGHVEPQYDSTIKYTILEGTGIKDGSWIMNFVCHNCHQWDGGKIDVTSSRQGFIFGTGLSTKILSNEPDATIYQHDQNGVFSLDLASATIAVTGNPFTSGSTSTVDTGGSSTSRAWTKADRTLLAHGLIMAISWLFLIPLGATIIRFLAQAFPRPVPLYLHAGLQISTFCLVLIGLAMGISTSDQNKNHFTNDHQKLGVAIIVLFFLQIPMGYIHHVNFVATRRRGLWSYAHIWNGRTVMVLGVVNGGLGLNFAGIKNPNDQFSGGLVDKKWVIAYSVVAGIVGSVYICGLIAKSLLGGDSKGKREKTPESQRLTSL